MPPPKLKISLPAAPSRNFGGARPHAAARSKQIPFISGSAGTLKGSSKLSVNLHLHFGILFSKKIY
jgi:hypothetical protein